MAQEVQVTKASSLQTSGGQTEGMMRQGAITNQSDKICASGKNTASFIFSHDPY